MGGKVAFLTVALVAVQCTHLINCMTFDSINNDGDWPFTPEYQEVGWPRHHNKRSNYNSVSVKHSNFWDNFDQNMMNVDSMVDNIMDNINKPLSFQNDIGDNFQKKLQSSIENSLKESMDSVKNLQEEILLDTKKMQEKNSKEQSKMIDGREGITLLEIEGPSKPKKQYIIENNKWYTCKDHLNNALSPVCASGRVETTPDVCAFNSIVKYKINRDPKNPIYTDDDILCLVKGPSNSVRQFSGVDAKTVKDTCTKGDIMTLKEYCEKCGEQQKIGYYYWPNETKVCNGSKVCSMIINWKIGPSGISQSTSSGEGSNNNSYSVVSSSVSNLG